MSLARRLFLKSKIQMYLVLANFREKALHEEHQRKKFSFTLNWKKYSPFVKLSMEFAFIHRNNGNKTVTYENEFEIKMSFLKYMTKIRIVSSRIFVCLPMEKWIAPSGPRYFQWRISNLLIFNKIKWM